MKKTKNRAKRIFTTLFLIALAVGVCASLYTDFFSDRIVVCVDAGHGGEDVGAVFGDNERFEKDDNLKLAMLVKKELEEKGARVLMTRSADRSVSLEKRCRIANLNRADYFICLHRNSAENKSALGTELWINSPPSEREEELSQAILLELEAVGISDNRGIKKGYREGTGNYYVNSRTDMPSCLVELGFISNEEDNAQFDENIEEYASAIADAVIKCYEKENQ